MPLTDANPGQLLVHPEVELVDVEDPILHPGLTEEQMASVAQYATRQTFEPGEVLFEQSQREALFYFVESGFIQIFEEDNAGQRFLVARVIDKRFVGDVAMFSGTPALAGALAAEPTTALVLDRHQLRELIAANSDVGDVILGTLIARRDWIKGNKLGSVKVIGSRWSRQAFSLRDYLARNQVIFEYLDVEADQEAGELLAQFDLPADDLPILICPKGVQRNPSLDRVASHLGLSPDLGDDVYDVAIIGGGPGGLAAAVYAASEGLSAVVIEAHVVGGQAGTSSRIENYLGFPLGIAGDELAERAILQARKFGATITSPHTVTSIVCGGGHKVLSLDDGRKVNARTVVLAMGVSYRKLDCGGCEDFDGKGVYYGASHTEAQQCQNSHAIVIGGGNSAGQAAINLAKHAREVSIVIRRKDLTATMSKYLIDRIESTPNITVISETQATQFIGKTSLEQVELTHNVTQEQAIVDCPNVFCMIGAEARTDWLAGCVALDPKGFILTGESARQHADYEGQWTEPGRTPMLLETSRPGIFAVGDVRAGSIKRVASAVGEGSMSIKLVHEHIAVT